MSEMFKLHFIQRQGSSKNWLHTLCSQVSLLFSLWVETVRPYLQIVDEWIVHGHLCDCAREFIIQRSDPTQLGWCGMLLVPLFSHRKIMHFVSSGGTEGDQCEWQSCVFTINKFFCIFIRRCQVPKKYVSKFYVSLQLFLANSVF